MRLLVGDDRADIREALRLLFKSAGHQAETVDSPQGLLGALERHPFDLILMDMNYARDTTSGREGIELLTRLRAQDPAAGVIVMTAWGNIDLAVEAMRLGASDFIQKPWDNRRLLDTVEQQAQKAAARRSAGADLEAARRLQQRLLPTQQTKTLETLDYCGRFVPAGEVGGDYYDFLDLGPGRLGIVLADASGKGVAGAMLMATLRGLLLGRADAPWRPASLAAGVNRAIYRSTPAEQYVSLFLGEYDDRTRRLGYVNCGHPAPLLRRRSGRVERLEASAVAVGLFPELSCVEAEVILQSGDTLVLYSDGVVEAGIDQGAEFGEERLLGLLRDAAGEPIERAVDRVVEAARAAGQTDDITVAGLRAR